MKNLFASLAIVAGLLTSAFAQQPTPDVTAGLSPYQSYHGGDIDRVNLQNGNLTVTIPLISYPQRGGSLKLDFALVWNGKPYINQEMCTPNQLGVPSQDQRCWWGWIQSGLDQQVSGWSVVDLQSLTPDGYTYTFTIGGNGCPPTSLNCQTYQEDIAAWRTSDGSKHVAMPFAAGASSTQGFSLPANYSGQIATDGTSLVTGYGQDPTTNPYYPVPCTSHCYTTGPDGIIYYPNGYLTGTASTSVIRQDVDENQITLNYANSTYTDTVGRVIQTLPQPVTVSSSNPLPQACNDPTSPYNTTINAFSQWQVPGANGSTLTYTFCFAPVSLNIPPKPVVYPSYARVQQTQELVRVALPNGLAWSFQYNDSNQLVTNCTYNGTACNYGDLSKVTFPTGGSLTYTYDLEAYSYGAAILASANTGTESMAVATRQVYDGASSNIWSYFYPPQIAYSESSVPNATTVQDPLGNQVVHTFSTLGDTAGNGSSEWETKTQYYSGTSSSGSLLKTIVTNYQSQGDYFPYAPGLQNVLPTSVVTTLDNKKSTTTSTTYCCSIGVNYNSQNNDGTNGQGGIYLSNPSSVSVYDYTGALIKNTATTYQFELTQGGSYFAENLIQLPSTVSIAGTSSFKSTTYCYDESTPTTTTTCSAAATSNPLSASISTQHGTALQPVRGHLTSTIHSLGSGTSPTSHTVWYDTGEPYQTTNGNGNTTTNGYSATYAGSLVTSISNPLSQQTSINYDPTLGLKTSVTDPNNQVTGYSYDSYGRLKSVTYPDCYPYNPSKVCSTDNGSTTYTYNDSATNPYVQVSLLSGVNSKADTEEVDLDGLGRQIHTKMLSDPVSAVEVDTTYDQLGRKASVSNPYRMTTDLTYGVTKYSYDALSRPSSVTLPDSSILKYTYTGAATQAFDAGNGKHTLSTVNQKDALGRVTSVCEVWSSSYSPSLQGSSTDVSPVSCGQDIAATGFLTTYGYDAFNDVISVTQGDLPSRSFIYDWMSRLTSAYNPESGTTTYTYDLNSNVHTRSRPAPNQASNGTVTATATYAYDALDRVTGVSYSDSFNTSNPTPPVNYVYDTAVTGLSLPSQYNLVGRLAAEYTSNASGFLSGRALSYDPVGRPIMMAECTVDDCNAHWYYELMYGYDITGNPLNLQLLTTDNFGYTLNYGYNNVNQLTQVQSSLVISPTYPQTLFQSGLYSPFGGLISSSLGNGATESYSYDQRNRLGCETVKMGSTTLYSLELSPANGQCSGNTFTNSGGTGYSGNSDVLESFDSVNGHLTYSYDDFNRLVGTTAVSGPWTGESPMSWTYDRFGNRWIQNLYGLTPQSYSFTNTGNSANVNNRMANSLYDAAGNLLLDPMMSYYYTYDDENRIIAVGTAAGSNNIAQYSYDPEGQRIRKISAAGTEEYVYDKDGHQIGDMQPNGTFNRSEIYLGDRHFATYDNVPEQTVFIHNDWQGTERVRSLYNGTSYETCSNLPFGDSQNCQVAGGGNDPSPLHYTGKMRDVETNLNYFGARYYSSGMGHWMSPDWAAKPAAVPYANYGDPQSLDLYAFVTNNPASKQDSDGHLISIWQYWASLTAGFGSQPGAVSSAGAGPDGIDPPTNVTVTVTVFDEEGNEIPEDPGASAQPQAAQEPAGEEREETLEEAWGHALEPLKPGEKIPQPWRYNMMNPGPLSPEDASTFAGGQYSPMTVGKDGWGFDAVYRVWGGDAKEDGAFYTPVPQVGGVQSKMELALPSNNTAENVTCVQLPPGTKVFVGPIASQGGFSTGGGIQILVPYQQ